MEALRARKQLALDTNLLLDLAAGLDFAHDFKEVFQRRGYGLLAPPTVLSELHEQSVNGATTRKRELARVALARALTWDGSRYICRMSKRELRSAEHECNDALILAETALARVSLLVTSDKHFLDIDEDALALVFSDADLTGAHPVHPKALVRAIR